MTRPDVPDAAAEAAREAARGTGLIFAGAMITQAFEYFYRLVLARGLGTDGFGTFSQARSVFLVLVVVAGLGLAPGVKRFVAKLGEEKRGAEARRAIAEGSRLLTGGALLSAVLLFLLAEPLATVFRNPSLALPLRILAVALPFAAGLEFVTRLGEAFRSFRAAVLARQLLDPGLRFAGSIVLLTLGAGLPALMGVYAGASLVALLTAVVLVSRLDRFRALERGPAPRQYGLLLRFSLPLMFGGVLFDFAERIDILMIGLFRDESQVGIYAAGSALSRTLLLLVSSTMPAVGTLAAEAVGRGSPEDISRLHRTTTRWMLFFTVPLAVGLLLFPAEAVSLLFGRDYAGAAPSLRLLVLAYLAGVLGGPVGLLLNALGKTHWTFGNMVVRTGLNIVLNLLLIPRFGVIGAALGTMLSLFAAVALMLFQLGSLAPIRGSYAGWGRPLGVLGVATGLGWVTARGLLATGLGGSFADWISALTGGVVLVVAFAVGVRLVPGCLQEGDLALVTLVREWLGRGRSSG